MLYMQQNARILVIDDNVDGADFMQTILDLEGFETAVAYDGGQGIEVALEFRPSIIICDLGMPVKNGYEVAKSLREHSEFNSIYLIALTGWDDLLTQAKVVDAGFNKHLTKPAAIEHLLQIIHTVSGKNG
jgi:DNA-binding response OmpR family regulator